MNFRENMLYNCKLNKVICVYKYTTHIQKYILLNNYTPKGILQWMDNREDQIGHEYGFPTYSNAWE